MHFLIPVMIGVSAAAWSQAATGPTFPGQRPSLIPGSECPTVTSHMAQQGTVWRSDPQKPQKLAELPPADTYAAVYQLDERGCMVPLMYPGGRPRGR